MGRGDFLPDEHQDALFEIEGPAPAQPEDIDPTLPIEEFAKQIAIIRQQNLEARQAQIGVQRPAAHSKEDVPPADPTSEAKKERKTSRTAGGSFVSGLKRYSEGVDAESLQGLYSDHDLSLLEPKSIQRQLHPVGKELTYNGILFSPVEYSRITLSPEALTKRVGAHVLRHTVGRLPSARNARKAELQQKAIENRAEAASAALADLHVDLEIATALEPEQAIPRYAHMTADRMDELVESMVSRFESMLEAITLNHGLPDERVESLFAALTHLLTQQDNPNGGSRKAIKYWHDLTNVYTEWTEQKIKCFEEIQQKVTSELVPSE